jgi:hypothetical protein
MLSSPVLAEIVGAWSAWYPVLSCLRTSSKSVSSHEAFKPGAIWDSESTDSIEEMPILAPLCLKHGLMSVTHNQHTEILKAFYF